MSGNEDSNKEHGEESPEESVGKKYPKALRIQRLAAFLIDYFILGLLVTPLSFRLGLTDFAESPELIPFGVILQLYIAMFVAFILINGWWIYRYGQTVGKRMLKIAIATMDFQVPPFNRVILVRHLPFAITWVVPGLILVNIVDWLLIMRRDCRCLHDLLAGTQVIDVSQAG